MAVMTYELVRQRDLLKLHLVHASVRGAHERARGEEDRRLHDDDEYLKPRKITKTKNRTRATIRSPVEMEGGGECCVGREV